MRYILCEDSGSGFYFWSLIKTYVLKEYYQMITPSIINSMLPKNKQCNTVGISVIVSFLEAITSEEYLEETKDNTYIICIDNVSDNVDVQNNIAKIFSIARTNRNIHVFDYICFEELVLAPGNYERFIPIPQVSNNEQLRRYNIIRQHYQKNGLGKSAKLARELNKANIIFSNTERIFNKIMENISVYGKQKIGVRYYVRMRHHYIYKGKWSACWKTDCTPNCPSDKCWEATEDNALMCVNCRSNLRGISYSCRELTDKIAIQAQINNRAKMRNYAEETTCTRNVSIKLKDRIQMLFDINEVQKIDDYE